MSTAKKVCLVLSAIGEKGFKWLLLCFDKVSFNFQQSLLFVLSTANVLMCFILEHLKIAFFVSS